MFVFHSVFKQGSQLKRINSSFRLEHSLSELFDIYESVGRAGEGAERAIGRRINRSLGERGQPRPAAKSRLQVLMRARDLHRYVTDDEELIPLKLEWMEHLLFFPNLSERWATIRELLLSQLETICAVAPLHGSGNLDAFKQQASLRSSRLGRLLSATALFNFDRDDEHPPPGLLLRFPRARFPEHTWEEQAEAGLPPRPVTTAGWNPANPLCRWEFLGADLLHAAIRRLQPERGGPAAMSRSATGPSGPAGSGAAAGGELIYCTYIPPGGRAEEGQMELLPVEPEVLLGELQRHIHRRWGAEGLRMLALLFARLDHEPAGVPVHLALADVALAAESAGTPSRKKKERIKKLWAVVEYLGGVELTAITSENGRSTAHTSRLLTILGTAGEHPDPHQPRKKENKPNLEGQTVRLVVDPFYYRAGGKGLGHTYRNIPETLLCCDQREHPQALGLFVYLRGCWEAEGGAERRSITRTARQLLHDAGFRLSESSRYRSLERLKGELDFLRELGLLGRWRLHRSSTRDALEEEYRMEAPNREEGGKAEISSSGTTASQVSA